MFSLWKGRFAFLPLGATLPWLFQHQIDTRLDREQIFVLHWGRSKALCNKKGSQLAGRQLWGIPTSLWISFCAGSDIFEGEGGVAFLRGSIEYVEASSFVISGLHTFHEDGAWVLHYYPMSGDKGILSLFLSFCGIFPDLSLYKSCHLLLAATAVPLRGWLWGRGVPGVCVVAPGHWQTVSLGTPLPASGQASWICRE